MGVTYQSIRCNQPPEKGYIREYIYRRIKNNNKNFLGAIVGETGGGKSYLGLRLCQDIDPNFTIDNVYLTSESFVSGLKKLQELAQMGIDISGKCLLFDEIQVSQSNRSWASKSNKLLNFILSTFRNMNLGVLTTTPNLAMLDSQSRMLLHGVFQAAHGGRSNKDYRVFTFRLLDPNPITGDIYYKKLRVHEVWNHRVVSVDKMKVYKPSVSLMKAYEAKKREFTERLNENIARELSDVKKENKPSITKEPIGNVADIVKTKRDMRPVIFNYRR